MASDHESEVANEVQNVLVKFRLSVKVAMPFLVAILQDIDQCRACLRVCAGQYDGRHR
jgi:hypothetical protein